MSSDIAIRVTNLSKCYQIYDNPRDRLKQFVVPRIKRAIEPLRQFVTRHPSPVTDYYKEFWALRDVSFELKRGETIGIIGRNGSGKSTLLQMICGTLTPTAGSIRISGRVAALLELGSGFNPEFTGCENVYMNGAVLGLSKEEIDARFSDIAAFADIGEFISQPVKTYSSGMMLRLAFAVIAHVDADILVIDEALAVGDAVFTQKCMRFIRKFKQNGTLLFVSHDMGSVLNLCEQAIWLHGGRVRQTGQTKEIAEAYLKYTLQEVYGEEAQLKSIEMSPEVRSLKDQKTSTCLDAPIAAPDYMSQLQVCDNLSDANGWKSGVGEILSVHLETLNSDQTAIIKGGEIVRMVIRAVAHQDLNRPILGFLVRDRLGQDLFGENTLPFTDLNPRSVASGAVFESEYVFRLPMLPNGQYVVMASLADGDLHSNVQHHWLHNALILNVSSSKVRWGLVGVQFDKINLKEVV